MQDLKHNPTDPRQISPLALAFIGDGVFELLVRERLLSAGTLPAYVLHKKTVAKVSAVAQASTYNTLAAVLSEEEQAILKRGRNANITRAPKSCSTEQYHKATAIEALFGYLYLKGDMVRVAQLFEVVDEAMLK